jgi:hypothetical protein
MTGTVSRVYGSQRFKDISSDAAPVIKVLPQSIYLLPTL